MFKWNGNVYESKDVCEAAIATSLSEALSDWKMAVVKCGDKELTVRVTATVLTGRGRPVGSKNADKGAVKLTGNHYVAVLTDGTLVYRNVKTALTGDVAKLFGPFNTPAGAMYAIEHNTAHERPVAFEAPVSEEVASAE